MTQLLKRLFAFLPHPLRVFFVKGFYLLLLCIVLPTLFLLNVVSAIFVGTLVVVGVFFFIVRVLFKFINLRAVRWLKDQFGVMPKEEPELSPEELQNKIAVQLGELVDAVAVLKKPMPTDVKDIAKEMQK
jgi:membrane protein implicated in regulation of membrane protease activity